MKTTAFLLCACFIVFPRIGIVQPLEEESVQPSDEGATDVPETSIYAAHNIKKPYGYVGMVEWVSLNFTSDSSLSIYYLPQTIQSVTMDDKSPAIGFETWEHDHYVRNTLVDKGEILALYSIADPTFAPNQYVGAQSDDSEKVTTTGDYQIKASSCDKNYKCNCVLWVRNCRASWLPTGMTYIWEKKSKINTQTPKKGRVPVMNIYYPYGHVGYITKVKDSKITIEEANYKSCKVSTRTDKPSNMKVVGYIKQ